MTFVKLLPCSEVCQRHDVGTIRPRFDPISRLVYPLPDLPAGTAACVETVHVAFPNVLTGVWISSALRGLNGHALRIDTGLKRQIVQGTARFEVSSYSIGVQ